MCVCVLLSLLYVTCSSIIQEKSSAGQEQGEGQLEFLLFLLRLVPLWLFSVVCFSNMLAILEVLATSPAPATFALSDLAFTEPPGSFFSCSVSGGVSWATLFMARRLEEVWDRPPSSSSTEVSSDSLPPSQQGQALLLALLC